jgi:hypothetical protein
MGVFDKVVKDAEEAMARDDPGQATQDMRAAQDLIGKQRRPRDLGPDHAPDPDQGGDQDGGDQDDIGEDW